MQPTATRPLTINTLHCVGKENYWQAWVAPRAVETGATEEEAMRRVVWREVKERVEPVGVLLPEDFDRIAELVYIGHLTVDEATRLVRGEQFGSEVSA